MHQDDSLVELADGETVDYDVCETDLSCSPTHTKSCQTQPCNSPELLESPLESQRLCSNITQLEAIKSKLKIAQYKRFQLEAIEALQCGKDVIVVQPTGSGKSLCYVAPALLNPGKVTVVIEPVVAVITNQIQSLRSKRIDSVALGRAAGNSKLANFRRVFKCTDRNDIPSIAFCTPEYLFGTPADGIYQATIGQFTALHDRQDYLYAVVMDEAHKIFDRVPSYRPAFDSMERLQHLSCKLLAMSATLTSEQVEFLKKDFLHGDNCVVITQGVHRDNLVLQLKRYKRQRQLALEADDTTVDECDEAGCSYEPEQSSWLRTALSIADVTESQVTVVYLDFVRDVEQMTELLTNNKVKAIKYTGKMALQDKVQAESKFLKGDASVLVATEAFELGVDNPRVTQVVRVGCPRNLGVLLQEFGWAGRKEGMIANALLYFNEYIDDKHLGLWLKSSLDSATDDETHQIAKAEIISNYTNAWKFIYSVYHGKCLTWALSHFYGGADDTDPPTCFVSNSPLCMVCKLSDILCEESLDIKDHLCTLLSTLQQLQNAGLNGITKTLLVGVLMKVSSQYIIKCLECIDADSIPWGCGTVVKGVNMSSNAWCKLIYVCVHLGLFNLSFVFRPFENHYEVHRRYLIAPPGEEFLVNPTTVMSMDPCSSTVDIIMIHSEDASLQRKKTSQSRGSQIKPKIVKLIEDKMWLEGNSELLKYLGFGNEDNAICMYFPDSMKLPYATPDIHHLLKCLQFSRSQATIKEIEVILDGKKEVLVTNRSYCSGIKVCAHEGCTYTVSTQQKINQCKEHPSMGLRVTGPCSCHIAYIYPKDIDNDGRRWFVALNTGSGSSIHNHPAPSEWRVPPKVLCDISNAVSRNTSISPKELQKGVGMDYIGRLKLLYQQQILTECALLLKRLEKRQRRLIVTELILSQ